MTINTEPLANLSPPETQDLNTAKVAYKGDYKSVVKKTISIPHKLHGFALLQCMIHFLQVKSAEKLYDLQRFVTVIQDFITHLEKSYNGISSIPKNILKFYSEHLSIVESNTPSSVRTKMASFSSILKWAIKTSWFKNLPEKDSVFILAVLSLRPSIPKNKMLDGVAPAMSDLISSKEYDDRDLLDSLARFCFGLLLIFRKHRELITSNRRVKARLDLARGSTNPDIDWHFFEPNLSDYNEIFNAIVDSRDAGLIERLLNSTQHFRDLFKNAQTPETLEDLYRKLKTCVRDFGSLRFTPKLSETVQYVTFEQLDIRSLMGTCEAEEICLRWLFGIDRIQLSGQQKLTLQDFELTPTHATISFIKRRSNEYQRDATSHKRKTINYKIISYILNLRQDFQKFIKNDKDNIKFFHYEGTPNLAQNHSTCSYHPIILACTPGTNLYKEINSMFPQAKLFQEYFRLLVDENTAGRREADELATSEIKTNPKTDKTFTKKLTANVIAQSRAIIDPEKPAFTPMANRRALAEAAADGTAHSIKTNQEIYKNRSQTAHRLVQRAKFVAQVGKLQEDDARKVSLLFSNTEVLSLSDVSELLGWDVSSFKEKDIEDFNNLIGVAEEQGYKCAPFGWLSKPNSLERIVIITPITAALILSFVQSCQNELKTSSSTERFHSILLQLSYAKMVLKSFDQRTIAEGRKMLNDYEFPPAMF